MNKHCVSSRREGQGTYLDLRNRSGRQQAAGVKFITKKLRFVLHTEYYHMKMNGWSEACGTQGRNKKCIQSSCGRISRRETIWKTWAWIKG
jgi:hypothetical protein